MEAPRQAPVAAPVRAADPWWAKGLIFENCMCTLVCPGHMHFTFDSAADVRRRLDA